MTIKHSVLTGSSLHEPKGVAVANNKEVYKANGTGSGAWDVIKPEEDFDTSADSDGATIHTNGTGGVIYKEDAHGCAYMDSTGATTGISSSFKAINLANLAGGISWDINTSHNMTFNNTGGYWTAPYTGSYHLMVAINLGGSVAAVNEYEFTVGVDTDPFGTIVTKEAVARSIRTATTTNIGHVSLTCLPELTAGQRVYLMIKRNSGAAEPVLEHINFVLIRMP
jgi:hypothetical protein